MMYSLPLCRPDELAADREKRPARLDWYAWRTAPAREQGLEASQRWIRPKDPSKLVRPVNQPHGRNLPEADRHGRG